MDQFQKSLEFSFIRQHLQTTLKDVTFALVARVTECALDNEVQDCCTPEHLWVNWGSYLNNVIALSGIPI